MNDFMQCWCIWRSVGNHGGDCRAAAYAALNQYHESREDASRCINLKPSWHKAWNRLGVAHVGLGEWSEAKEAFTKAMELEPDDKSIQTSWAQVCCATQCLSDSSAWSMDRQFIQAAVHSTRVGSYMKANSECGERGGSA